MSKRISILVATYNGERYIRQQIESLLNQTIRNIEIKINDDYSTDSTYRIIEEMAINDCRIAYSRHQCGGAAENFKYLIERDSGSDYVFLCDQDDVWYPNKVERSIEVLEKEDPDRPALVYCDRIYVDEFLEPIRMKNSVFRDRLKDILCQNHIYGCTIAMNRALVNSLSFPRRLAMHDYWIVLYTALRGRILKIDAPLMLYRQHNNNVTGGVEQFGIAGKIKNWEKVNTKQREAISMCLEFCDKYSCENDVLRAYASIFSVRGIMRLLDAVRFHYKRDNLLASIRAYYILLTYKVERS